MHAASAIARDIVEHLPEAGELGASQRSGISPGANDGSSGKVSAGSGPALGPIGNIPPAEPEANHYVASENLDMAARLKPNCLRETRGRFTYNEF